MATVEESRLLSDLGEISAALEGDLEGITPTKAFQGALDEVRTRCEDAITTLRDARTLYEADTVENKVVMLTHAEAMQDAVAHVIWLKEGLYHRLRGRESASLDQVERLKRSEWLEGVFTQPPSWWARASHKDGVGALIKIVTAVEAEGTFAHEDERQPLSDATQKVKGTYAALVKERLDDKPISDALKAAFTNASTQRSGARGMIQAVLSSEGSALSLDDFLRRRTK